VQTNFAQLSHYHVIYSSVWLQQRLRCICPYLNSKNQPVPSLPLLSTLNLTNVTLYYIFLSLK